MCGAGRQEGRLQEAACVVLTARELALQIMPVQH